ncbi:hypothetical protein HAX54_031880, partial [Datura stramonium]|nr:hypothetical protein [Datura stramonium]
KGADGGDNKRFLKVFIISVKFVGCQDVGCSKENNKSKNGLNLSKREHDRYELQNEEDEVSNKQDEVLWVIMGRVKKFVSFNSHGSGRFKLDG